MAQDKELQKSEERLRTVINSIQFGIFIIDAQTHIILDANNKALEMIGASSESVSGSVCHRFICLTELGKCPVTDLGQTVESSERVLLNLQGKRIPILKSVIRTNLDGKDVLIESFIDITVRKRAEEAVHEANKKLHLLSSITRHDILNQLMGLKGYIYLSKETINNPTILAGYIQKEEQVVNAIEHQIKFTRDYQELGVAAPEWQNVNASIKKVVAKLPMRHIHIEVDPNNPEIFADKLFEKVFYNLIDNSLNYGGDQMKTIRISSQESDSHLMIVFEDDGVGISSNDKKKLFKQGFGKNTGLGLFLSREILSITGITIIENGTPGKGARFEITVPKEAYRFADT